MFDVIEHVSDDAEVLAWAYSRLKPGGRLYLTVPAYGWLWSIEDVDAGHYRRYTREALSEKLRENGFEVSFASYFFAPLVLPIFVLRAIPSRLRIRRVSKQSTRETEHNPPAEGLLHRLLARERRRLGAGRLMPFGSSVIVAAAKPPE
jgi:SAM-dependent methyltransferase